ncbi:polysaccharide biosynthesis C-terminal domain-containing protein [Mangrovibacterium marinum]|uniref:O-antigen/teichoic acid export membrane protein n=1 Tax=Mangrovibacterium marinum TaxID=1639118 RepID=A0A2T5C2F1_9BACT|nr:polysaccharide biosynthesis C-terminal domain-containing protein [Mangrovibacterium marinum]PTN08831.1 O-antigen/teichoic acid export membrane protein [Mangrovibacterium marinum]
MKLKLTTITAMQLNQLMRYGSMILIGVVMAKSTLGIGAIGLYEQFLFIAGSVSFFWLNGLLRGLLPLYEDDNQVGIGFFNAFLLLTVLSVFAGALVFSVGGIWFPGLVGGNGSSQLWMLACFLFFSGPASLTENYFLVRKRTSWLIAYGIFSAALMLVAVLLPVFFHFGIDGCIRGLVGWALVRYVVLWLFVLRGLPFRFSWAYQKEHIRLSYPLVLSALLSGSAQYVDGFIIRSRYDEQVFAVFRFGARELPLVSLLANAFSNAILPAFAGGGPVDRSLTRIRKESSKMANYLFPLSAVLLLTSHLFFPLFFNAGFSESATVFNIYLLLIISRLLFPQTILIGLKQTDLIWRASLFELLLNACLSLLLVRFWGISGVAWATVVAYLAEKIGLSYAVKAKLGISWSSYQNLTRQLIYSLLLLLVFYLVECIIY